MTEAPPKLRTYMRPRYYMAICRVTDVEFERAKGVDNHVVLTESAPDRAEVAIAFKPRAEHPKAFRFFKLYR